MATITGETVSAQTVSKLTWDLDEAVRQFHQARLSDDYVYLFLDGVSLRVRRPSGRKQIGYLFAFHEASQGSMDNSKQYSARSSSSGHCAEHNLLHRTSNRHG